MTQVSISLASSNPENVLPMPPPADVVISLRNLSLSVGSRIILNDISLETHRGSIFCLLGPSGCGKTSLIRCILGTLKHTSGSVTVFGQPPGSSHCSVPGAGVGYMPQEITLYDDLTIRETLAHFGSLYAMSRDQVKERTSFLVNFLNLPDSNQLVRNLSGGQKRCVSLATALIHKPPLLLLDEPTVGCDYSLCHSIWVHLIELSQRYKVTVFVGTHDIQEATKINLVGLMKDGMLTHKTPAQFLEEVSCDSLEDVFLNFNPTSHTRLRLPLYVPEAKSQQAQRDSTSSSTSSGVVSVQEENQRAIDVPHIQAANPLTSHIEPVNWRTQMAALIGKNINAIWRNNWLMVFNFFLPIVELVFFILSLCFKGNSTLILGTIVNFLDVITVPKGLTGAVITANRAYLGPVIRQHHYSSPAEAIAAVENDLASGALSFSPNFLSCLQERLMLMGEIGSDMLYNSTIHLYPDMANQLNVTTIQKEVLGVLVNAGKAYLGDVGARPNLLDIPFQIEKIVIDNEAFQFTFFMAPGVIRSIAFLSALRWSAFLITGRRQGLMERNVVAGVPRLLLLLSHLLSQAFILAIQVVLLMLTAFPVSLLFQVPFNQKNFFSTVFYCFLQSLAGLVLGFFLALFCKKQTPATVVTIIIFAIMFCINCFVAN